MEVNKIYNEDCLEGMKRIPDKSVDLIVTDPPYNIGKASWDNIPNYIEWMGAVFLECQRVLKDNGSFYWFHNDMPQIAQLMEWLRQNTRFVYNSFITWDKGDFRALSWKNPSKDNNLRSWFSTAEYCLFYTFQDSTGLEYIDKEFVAPRNPFRKELIKARQEAGLKIKDVAEKGKFYGNVNHGGAVTNWEKGYNIPLPAQWELMKSFLPLRREYEDLRREYEDSRYTHNLAPNHKNIWKDTSRNTGKNHPTEKPISIIERIVKTSSNEGDTVLDCFMGSGTTAIACINTNRFFIGFEMDKGYYDIATKRIQDHQQQLAL